MKQRSNQTNQYLELKALDGIDFKVKHILIRGYESLYYKRLNLFIIHNEHHQFDCWSQLQDSSFQQDLKMNEFLNDNIQQYVGTYGSCDSHYLLKQDNCRLGIYDLLNLKKYDLNMKQKYSNIYLRRNNSRIIGIRYNTINIYTLYNKKVKKIMFNGKYISNFSQGSHISELGFRRNHIQFKNKSFKILRIQRHDINYCFPTQYCKKFLISQQEEDMQQFALIHDKCSIKIKIKLKIYSDLEDYIEVEEKHIIIILTTKTIFIYNTFNFSLISSIHTIHSTKNYIHFMTYDSNTLQIIYTGHNYTKNFTIKQI